MPSGCETKGKLLIGPKVKGPLRALGMHTSMMVTKQIKNEAELCWNAGEDQPCLTTVPELWFGDYSR